MASALAIVFAPLVATGAVALLGTRAARLATLASMLVVAALALAATADLVGTVVPLPVGTAPAGSVWFAVDAANVAFLLLTAVAFPVVLVGSWTTPEMSDRTYLALLLALESTLLGTFLAQDLLVLFVCWEAALLPMLAMIVLHGGAGCVRAALAFFLYTMAGSVPFLAAVLALGAAARTITGTWAFDLATLQALPLDDGVRTFAFGAIAFACAIKAPVFPLHGWLPRTYAAAPASGTALMAGVLSKMGAFGLLRLAIPLAPLAATRFAPAAIAIGVASLLYGAFLALRERRPRTLVAYASLSHMGYVVVGAFTLNAIGLQGAVLQVLSHGLCVVGLFLLVGRIERRSGENAGGGTPLAHQAPRLASVLVLFVLASVALPATSGFTAEFHVLLGTFTRALESWRAGEAAVLVAAVLASTGVVLGATYMLRFVQQLVFEPSAPAAAAPADLGLRDLGAAGVLLAGILWLGIAPGAMLRLAEPATDRIVAGAAQPARADEGHARAD